MVAKSALDRAVRRFPWRLADWRRHGMTSQELHQIAPEIIAEYHRILTQETATLRIEPEFTTRPLLRRFAVTDLPCVITDVVRSPRADG
jgi:hypothetical protein